MKKIYKNALSLLIVLLSLQNGYSQSCGGVYDDFETGSLGPAWQTGTGVYTRLITSTAPGQGVYSFEQTGSSSFYQGTYQTFPAAQPTYISWWAKTSSTTVANGYFVAGDNNINSDNGILFAYFNSSSSLRFFANTGYNHPITANTWYHIEVMNINYTTRTMDIAVNGTTILTAWPFRSSSANTFTQVHLFNLSSATATYDNIQIGTPSPGVDSLVIMDVACAGDANGEISLNTVGGTPPYTYAWSNGQTTEDLVGLTAGSYSLSITDSAGCMAQDSFTVSQPAAMVDTATITDNICPSVSAGGIALSVSGGTPGYTYQWSNGDTTDVVGSLGAGAYAVSITDGNGCVLTDSFWVSEPAAWNINVQLSDPLCRGDANGSIDLTVGGATPGYTYMWSTGDSTEDLTGLSAGGYSLVIMDSVGCMTQDSFNLSEPTAISIPSAIITDEVSMTSFGAIDLTVTGGTPPYTYAWSNGATTEDISGLTAGTYTITITDANGCVHSDFFFVDFIVGMDELAAQIGLRAFPNPFNDQLTVVWDPTQLSEGQLSLVDLQGRTLQVAEMGQNGNGQIIWQLNIPAGFYFLQLEAAGQKVSHKLIKE